MPRRVALCGSLGTIALLLVCAAAEAPAIVPPAPGSGARLPEISPQLRAAGFGRVSRPAVRLHALPAGAAGSGKLLGAPAVTGSRALPVLLGDTSDRPGTQTAATLQAELFGSWPTGSLAQYYQQVSYGAFSVTGAVHGWYRVANPITYYEGSWGCNGLCAWPHCAGVFVREVVALADATGFDWGQFDNDGPDGVPNSGDDDGYVDTVVIVHAGKGGECGGANAIWSHSFSLRGWGSTAYATHSDRAGGGKILVDDYIVEPEQSCGGGLIEIGVFCHEYGHALGLPDLYDTVAPGEGVGRWCVMGSGNWGGNGSSPQTPVQMCAWSKAYLGWIAPEPVRWDGAVELPAVETAPAVRRFWSAGAVDGGEYFLVENRQKALNDTFLPGSGLLIWHVDETAIAAGWGVDQVNAGPIYGVALEQADGLDQLAAGANLGDAGDPWPGSASRALFANGTSPSSRANGGAATSVAVRDVPASAAVMSPRIEVGVAPDVSLPVVLVQSPNGGESWAIGGTATIRWDATDNVGVSAVSILLSRDGGATWPTALVSGLPNTGRWLWQVPLAPSGDLRVRVVAADAAGNLGHDDSDGTFTISDQYSPGITLTAPAGGGLWSVGQSIAVAWTAADNLGVTAVDLFLSRDGGSTWPDTVAFGLVNAGHYTWAAPRLFSDHCRLRARARDAAGNAAEDTSAAFVLANLTATADAPALKRLAVGPGFPNPFNPSTTIRYYNPAAGPLEIAVFDLVGRRVRTLLNAPLPAGPGYIKWDGRDDDRRLCGSGVYHIQATAQGYQSWVKVTLVR